MPERFTEDHNKFAAAFGAIIFIPLDVLNLALSIPIGVLTSKEPPSNLQIALSIVSLPLVIPILLATKLTTYVLAMATGSHALEHAQFASDLLGVKWANNDGMAEGCCVSYQKDIPVKGRVSHVGRMITTIPGLVAFGAGIIITIAAKSIGNLFSSIGRLKDSAISKFKSSSADKTIKNPHQTLTANNLGNLNKNESKTPTTASETSNSSNRSSSISSNESNFDNTKTGPK